jgi:two-component system chemotaxis sensor kinase CheA
LCKPILHQGKLLGVLYLENQLVCGAFTAEHQEVLEILSSQAAIAFENARHYRVLEHKVEERTSELRRKTSDLNAMLDNLEQGVFTILKDGTIHLEYSRQLEIILGTRAVAGRQYAEAIFAESTLGSDAVDRIKAAVALSVGNDVLWYDSNRHLLVREIQRRRPDGTLATLELNWSPIVTDDDVVEKLLVSVKDVTELRTLEREARDQRRDLEVIGQILAVSRRAFLDFVRDTERLLEASEGLVTAAEIDADAVAACFGHMHTIKGNARMHSFDSLAHAAHEAEETYAASRSLEPAALDRTRLRQGLAAVRECLGQYRRVYENNLESFLGTASLSTLVDDALLEQMRAAIAGSRTSDLPSLVEAIGTSTLAEIVGSLTAGVREAARRLGKPAPRLHVRSTGVRFRPEAVPLLRDALMHVLRNALGHGIETVAERVAQGKPEAGEIVIVARAHATAAHDEADGACEVVVRDDGRGLPVVKLRDAAALHGLAAQSDDELAELPFHAGLSTSGSVTEMSGRGVGMDAVRRMVTGRGGAVRIELLPADEAEHRPFAIRFGFPESLVVRVPQDGATQPPAEGAARLLAASS